MKCSGKHSTAPCRNLLNLGHKTRLQPRVRVLGVVEYALHDHSKGATSKVQAAIIKGLRLRGALSQ